MSREGISPSRVRPSKDVEVEDQRSRIGRGRGDGNEGVAFGPRMQGSNARLQTAGSDSGRPGAQPNGGLGARIPCQESSEKDSSSRHLGVKMCRQTKSADSEL